jgi:hypothetical protein
MMFWITLAVLTGSLQAGTITGGSLTFGDNDAYVQLSGSGFSAVINDDDVAYPYGGLTPFTLGMVTGGGVGYGSSGWGSGITYDGAFYSPWSIQLPTGIQYVDPLSYSLELTSPPPMVTGPGTYTVDFSIQMNFCLHTQGTQYCEQDTGTAMGSFVATSGNPNTSWVSLSPLEAIITPSIEQTEADPPSANSPEPPTFGYGVIATILMGIKMAGARAPRPR